jgi:hypothetical protein
MRPSPGFNVHAGGVDHQKNVIKAAPLGHNLIIRNDNPGDMGVKVKSQ